MCHNEVYKCLVCKLFIGQDTQHCAASALALIANEHVKYCRNTETCDSWVIFSKEAGLDVKTNRGTGLFTKGQTFPVYADSGLLLHVNPHNFLQVDVICRLCKAGPLYRAKAEVYENQCNWVHDPFGSKWPVAKIRWEVCRDTSDLDYGRPARWVTREVVPGLDFYGGDEDDQFQKERRRRPLQPTYECKIQAYPLERVLFWQSHPTSVYCYTAPPSEMWGGYAPARSPLDSRQARTVQPGGRPLVPQAVVNGPDSGYGSQTQPFGGTMEAPADMSPPLEGMFGPPPSSFADSTYGSRKSSSGNMLQLPAQMPEAYPGMFGLLPGTTFDPTPITPGAYIGMASASSLPQPSGLGGQELQYETGKSLISYPR